LETSSGPPSTQAVSCIRYETRTGRAALSSQGLGAAIALPGGLEIRRYEQLIGVPGKSILISILTRADEVCFSLGFADF
jgi:hypothetical protein